MRDTINTFSGVDVTMSGRLLQTAIVLLLTGGILLTTATQLRPAAIPVGIGEALVAAWVVWQLAVILLNPLQNESSDIMTGLALFWFFLFTVMFFALAISYQLGTWDERGAAHDAFALLFSALYSMALAYMLSNEYRIRQLAWIMVWMSAMAMGLLLLLFASGGTFLGIDPWYAALRFTGWAKNPNQIGVLLVALPFLALWLRPTLGGWRRLVMVISLFVLVVAGLLCRSDALYVGWAAGGAVALVLVWFQSFQRTGRNPITSYLVLLGVPGLFVAVLSWFAVLIFAELSESILNMYELGSQGSVRLQIWSHGVAAFAESPLIGHGPGAFAGVRDSFLGFEAHNTFIDLATKSGMLGLTVYVLVLAALHIQLLRTRQYLLLGALVSITVFSFFHYVLRQPIYWTVIVICLHGAWSYGFDRRSRNSVATEEIGAGATVESGLA